MDASISAGRRLVGVEVRVIDTISYKAGVLVGCTTQSSDTRRVNVCRLSVEFTW